MQKMELGSIHRKGKGQCAIVEVFKTMEVQRMKKSIGMKLLAGIISVSMILGIPVAGYSQDEEALLTAAVSEEAPSTEEVLAGADDIAAPAAEVQIPEAPAQEEVAEPAGEDTEVPDAADEVTEEDAVVDEAVEDVFEEEIFVAAEEEEVAEEPADGILLEAAEEDRYEYVYDRSGRRMKRPTRPSWRIPP